MPSPCWLCITASSIHTQLSGNQHFSQNYKILNTAVTRYHQYNSFLNITTSLIKMVDAYKTVLRQTISLTLKYHFLILYFNRQQAEQSNLYIVSLYLKQQEGISLRREIGLAFSLMGPINHQRTKATKTSCDFICKQNNDN